MPFSTMIGASVKKIGEKRLVREGADVHHGASFVLSLLLVYMIVVPSLILCFPGLWGSRIRGLFSVHRPVKEQELAAMELVYRGRRVLTIGDSAKPWLLGAYNDIYFLAKRSYKVGSAAHLRLRLRSGDSIMVMAGKNKNDLYVVRMAPSGKTTSYWGMHQSLHTYLAHQLWLSNPKATVTNRRLKRIK